MGQRAARSEYETDAAGERGPFGGIAPRLKESAMAASDADEMARQNEGMAETG